MKYKAGYSTINDYLLKKQESNELSIEPSIEQSNKPSNKQSNKQSNVDLSYRTGFWILLRRYNHTQINIFY